jgi:hypothetical protein
VLNWTGLSYQCRRGNPRLDAPAPLRAALPTRRLPPRAAPGRGYSRIVGRTLTLLTIALVATGLSACSGPPVHRAQALRGGQQAAVLTLSCSASVGQQGRDHETAVGGVEGLILPGSSDPASLYPIRGSDGHRYFVYKAFLAVSSASAPFATVSIVRPATARLIYGAPSKIGEMFGTASGQELVAASRTKVRLPVCGPRFTGFVGGIIVSRPACVTFAVSSPGRKTETKSAAIGPSVCPRT